MDLLLWLATLVPVSAQLWLINDMGGLDAYRTSMTARAITFEGRGWLVSIACMIAPLHCCYLTLLLGNEKRPHRHFPYVLHFITASLVLIAGGTRANLMEMLIVCVGVRHYLVERIRPRTVAILGVICLGLLACLGALRLNQRSLDLSDISNPINRYEYDGATGFFGYGPASVSVVLGQPSITPKYGYTYLAAIANLVPRAWWPDKPTLGGKVLTIELLGDPNHGGSNVNPAYLAESMYNFGRTWGCVLGIITLSVALAAVARRYVGVTALQPSRPVLPLSLTFYVYLAVCVGEATFGDFSTVFGKLLLVGAVVWPISFLLKLGTVRSLFTRHRSASSPLYNAPF